MNRSSSPPGAPRSPWQQPEEAGADSLQTRVQQQRAIREAEMARQEAAFLSSVQRRRELEMQRSDAKLGTLLRDVLSGMAAPEGPVKEAEAALAHATKVRGKKKESLHQEWETKVFDTLQGRLQSALDERDPAAIESRLKTQYDQYLHTTNTKVGVFRDVIIEQDYNPLTAAKAAIRIPTGDIRDPLKRDVLKREYEQRLMMSGGSFGTGRRSSSSQPRSASAGSQVGGGSWLGKETLDTRRWGELAVGATPFGHCNDGMGAYVVRPNSSNPCFLDVFGICSVMCVSRVVMDHYDYPRTNDAAAAEVPPGKRILPGPEQLRGRKDLFDVVHHTCHLKPENYTGGDQWLEARGKAKPLGPEQRRGRRDLSDVLRAPGEGRPPPAPTPGAPVGDLWLDAKGKARAEGPEVRRGRAGLYETLQQSSNPYEGGSKVGDLWLEYRGKRVLPRLVPEAGAALAGIPAPLVPRRPADERKFASHLVVAEGQVTTKD
ncbi:hypothetical protein VOLCADRAFT_90643 [Volvox carteri f. nagariensis]|uniref:Uncharacterized protein n=1 Tax=Volvox carteri f. nagariensis TaxID=3068 RepID=D8TUY5_VOLCA|nr:uncharacterized protein VOLCADRAFT_90643 [Volvox carteri f. nagariensis]EFJ48794.1 hypothetical protein VOLCADRAFT_90643 [Volvox carteri f. nagariensis]|eukprot:XP_002950126.1 hypothetical protein VOLCADRAFT_90643 [Volvox carteri f. nagariensis]